MTDLLAKLHQHAVRTPDMDALVDARGRRLSWSELDVRTARIASGFRERGLRPKDRVAIGVFTGFSALEMYLGAQRAHLVPVVLGPGAASGLVGGDITEAFVGPELRAAVPSSVPCYEIGAELPLSVFAGESTGPAEPHRSRPEHDTAALHYGTGSTGSPKSIERTVGSDFADAVNRCLAMGIEHGDRWLCAAPRNTNVAIGALRCILLVGGTVMVLDEVTPDAIERQTRDGVDVLPLQPHDWRTLLTRGVADLLPERGLRVAVATGGKIDPGIMRRLDLLTGAAGRALNIYGLTEAGAVAVSTNNIRESGGQFTVGVPTPLIEVRIEAEADSEDGSGEVLLRGPSISHSGNDWLRTGDIGAWDSQGFLDVFGRTTDLVVIAGREVHPAAIESELCSVDGIHEALVVQSANEPARVVVSCDEAVDPGAVRAVLRRVGADLTVYRLMSMPRNNGGKTDRRSVAAIPTSDLTPIYRGNSETCDD